VVNGEGGKQWGTAPGQMSGLCRFLERRGSTESGVSENQRSGEEKRTKRNEKNRGKGYSTKEVSGTIGCGMGKGSRSSFAGLKSMGQ